jgi:hypothetical protein
LAGLSQLARRSNELTGDLLAHLAELEQRMLHLKLGFASLFAYCVEALGLSEGAAGRRVAAARVCRRFPEAFALVARGDLHLSALCALSPRLSADNASGLFETCRGKTRRQVDELLAARFPRADIRAQIRRLPVREGVLPVASVLPNERDAADTAQSVVTAQPHELAAKEPERTGGSAASVPVLQTPAARVREIEPLSFERFGVHFTADGELRELIERARAAVSVPVHGGRGRRSLVGTRQGIRHCRRRPGAARGASSLIRRSGAAAGPPLPPPPRRAGAPRTRRCRCALRPRCTRSPGVVRG